LQRKQKPVPEGWVQDKEGKSSYDAHELKKGGACYHWEEIVNMAVTKVICWVLL
jgi:hypothetical protein